MGTQRRLLRPAFALSILLTAGAGIRGISAHVGLEAFAFSGAAPRRAPRPLVASPPRPPPPAASSSAALRASSRDDDGAGEKYVPPRTAKRTLYDVLRSSPDATRDELKTQYVALARESHPDAVRGLEDDPDRPDFNDVARAWKTLSDPRERKKYDRALRAERFTEDAERLAADALEVAVPRVRRILDKFAAPLVRRTTVTAKAGFEAAAKDALKKKEGDGGAEGGGAPSVDLGRAFASAVRASRRAGRAVDRLELLDKSRELEGRAEEEAARAAVLKDELAAVVEERLRIALRTPNADLSSMEALRVLDGFNTVDSVSLVESVVLLRKTLMEEISALEEAERQYYEQYDSKTTATKEYAEQSEALRQAKLNAEAADLAERRAREALDAARDLVASSRRAVIECGRSVASLEGEADRTGAEMERAAENLQRRRERVRRALRKKEEASRLAARGDVDDVWATGVAWKFGQNLVPFNSTDGTHYFDAQAIAAVVADLGGDIEVADADDERQIQVNLAKLQDLRKTERMLTAESTRLESRAVRLQSRAQKLKNRANGTTGEQNPLATSGLSP